MLQSIFNLLRVNRHIAVIVTEPNLNFSLSNPLKNRILTAIINLKTKSLWKRIFRRSTFDHIEKSSLGILKSRIDRRVEPSVDRHPDKYESALGPELVRRSRNFWRFVRKKGWKSRFSSDEKLVKLNWSIKRIYFVWTGMISTLMQGKIFSLKISTRCSQTQLLRVNSKISCKFFCNITELNPGVDFRQNLIKPSISADMIYSFNRKTCIILLGKPFKFA